MVDPTNPAAGISDPSDATKAADQFTSSVNNSFLLICPIQASMHLPQPVQAVELNFIGFHAYLHIYLFLNLL